MSALPLMSDVDLLGNGQWPKLNNATPSLRPHLRTFDATTGCFRPCVPRRYSRPRGWSRLWLVPSRRRRDETPVYHVPYESLVKLHEAFMPDAARAILQASPS